MAENSPFDTKEQKREERNIVEKLDYYAARIGNKWFHGQSCWGDRKPVLYDTLVGIKAALRHNMYITKDPLDAAITTPQGIDIVCFTLPKTEEVVAHLDLFMVERGNLYVISTKQKK